MSIADLRQSYHKFELLEATASADPYVQFDRWLQEAMDHKVREPTAMALATADTQGHPSVRIVLLKEFDPRGFVFYTNYTSRKGEELAANKQASLLFFWPELERQVRIEGPVSRIDTTESDAYYHSRPLGSRIGAWASPQSQPTTREALTQRVHELTQSLGENPERPSFWGGLRLAANRLEFWQGRPSRLHDRLVYTREAGSRWNMIRIAP